MLLKMLNQMPFLMFDVRLVQCMTDFYKKSAKLKNPSMIGYFMLY